jgi:hypothetical protein
MCRNSFLFQGNKNLISQWFDELIILESTDWTMRPWRVALRSLPHCIAPPES